MSEKSRLFSRNRRSGEPKRRKSLPHHRRLGLEPLESRRLLTAAYDEYDIIAQSGQDGISSINMFPSINDQGDVAFIAFREQNGRDAVFVRESEGELTNLSGDGSPNITYLASAQINNDDKVLATQRTLSPRFNQLNLWDVHDPGSYEPLAWVGGTGTSIFTFASIDNDGGTAFAAIESAGTNVSLRRTPPEASLGQWVTYLIGPQPNLFPMAADDGRFVFRWEGPGGDSIAMYKPPYFDPPLFNPRVTIASAPDFTDLGRAPGISDDSQVVTFSATLTEEGATQLNASQPSPFNNLHLGRGIFASIETTDHGRIIQRIAGISGDGYLDPGEDYEDINGNGEFDPTAGELDTGGFTSFSDDSRVGVSTIKGDSPDADNLPDQPYVTVVFVGTKVFRGTGTPRQGIYTSRINFLPKNGTPFLDPQNPGDFLITSPINVVEVYGAVPNLDGSVQELSIWDPVNSNGLGDVVFWVKTSSTQAIVKATPQFDSPFVDQVVRAPYFTSFTQRNINQIILHATATIEQVATRAFETGIQYVKDQKTGEWRPKLTKVSIHYLVGSQGTITQFVRESDAANHAPPANTNSIGIELVDNGGHKDNPDWATPSLLKSLLARIRGLISAMEP